MLSKTFAKYIQSLHHKKHRDEENSFIAEGEKVVLELLLSGTINCTAVLATSEWLNKNEKILEKYSIGELLEIKDFELEKISALSTPNQVLGVFKKTATDTIIVNDQLSIMLDGIQDPGNMGTILRTADWFGIKNIICSLQCADIYNPKVVQSTMGSIARVNVLYTDLTAWIAGHDQLKIYAAVLNGKNIKEIKKLKEGVILIGNESKGISTELLQLVNEKITIEKYGGAESLNAAVATGIILSHIT
ncbi:MAG: RNA methyltransferase [Ferruginibacter sp.]